MHRGFLLGATFGQTSKQQLPMLTLTFIIDSREVKFALVWGAHPVVDQRNGYIVDSLHTIAGLPLEAEPDWETLVERLEGRQLFLVLGTNKKSGDLQLEQIPAAVSATPVGRKTSKAQELNDWEGVDPTEDGDD